MQIEYLQCFQAVAEHKSFSLAADSLYISQSSLSKRIKSLEDELGGALFIRKNNSSVSLTPFGEYCKSYINNILEDYSTLCQSVDNFRLNRHKKLTIAMAYNVASEKILRPITTFEAKEENFHLETLERNHIQLRQVLNSHQVDIVFGYKELLGEYAEYDCVDILRDTLVLVTSGENAQKHQWESLASLSDAKGTRFCFPREDMELFNYYLTCCKSCSFTPQLTLSDVRLGMIKQYILAGMRTTLMMENTANSTFAAPKFRIIHLKENFGLTLAMYVDSVANKSVKTAFSKAIINYFNDENRL